MFGSVLLCLLFSQGQSEFNGFAKRADPQQITLLAVENPNDHSAIYDVHVTLRFGMSRSAWSNDLETTLVAVIAQMVQSSPSLVQVTLTTSPSVITEIRVRPIPISHAACDLLLSHLNEALGRDKSNNIWDLRGLTDALRQRGFPPVDVSVLNEPHAPALTDVVASLSTELQTWKINATVAMGLMADADLNARTHLVDEIDRINKQILQVANEETILEQSIAEASIELRVELQSKLNDSFDAMASFREEIRTANASLLRWREDHQTRGEMLAHDWDQATQLIQQIAELMKLDGTTQLTDKSAEFREIAQRNDFSGDLESCDTRDAIKTQLQQLMAHLSQRVTDHQNQQKQVEDAYAQYQHHIKDHLLMFQRLTSHYQSQRIQVGTRIEKLQRVLKALKTRKEMMTKQILRFQAHLVSLGDIFLARELSLSIAVTGRNKAQTMLKLFQTKAVVEAAQK